MECENDINTELANTVSAIKESVPECETIAVLYDQARALSGTSGPIDPHTFNIYACYNQDPQSVDPNKLSINYLGINWVFTREANLGCDYRSFILISREAINGAKEGLIILLADMEQMIIAVTCQADALRQVNLGLTALMDQN